jgi:hypothetical protein
VQAYKDQLISRVQVDVILSGNRLTCPSHDAIQRSGLDAKQIQNLGCGPKKRSGSAVRAVLIAFLVLPVIAVAAIVFLLLRRRRVVNKQAARAFSDPVAGAEAYVHGAETDRISNSGTGGAGFLLGNTSDKGFKSNLTESRSGVWGLMPQFLKDGTGPMSGMLSKHYNDVSKEGMEADNPAFAGAASRARTGPTLPVSGPPVIHNVGTSVGAARREAGNLQAVELSSPMSDLSEASLRGVERGNTSAGLDIKDGSDSSDSNAERNMRVTFNAAFAPGEH